MTASTTTHALRTDRLYLRPCRADDLDSLHALWTDVDVRRFLFDDRPILREEAQSFVDASETSFTDRGHGLWLFFEHDRAPVAGFAGLLPVPQSPPSLIFGTRPALWGLGYASEAASTVLRYGFDVLGLERVTADVDEPNEASVRVLERLGMSRTHQAIVDGRPLLYYEIHTRGKDGQTREK